MSTLKCGACLREAAHGYTPLEDCYFCEKLNKAKEATGNLPKFYLDGIWRKNGITYAVLREKYTGLMEISATLDYILDRAKERGYVIEGVSHHNI